MRSLHRPNRERDRRGRSGWLRLGLALGLSGALLGWSGTSIGGAEPARRVDGTPRSGRDQLAGGQPPSGPARATTRPRQTRIVRNDGSQPVSGHGAATAATRGRPVDLWIRGGEVIDGSGEARTRADILVDMGTIVQVGPVPPDLQARRCIDARGQVVAPGFIDAHSHGDPETDCEAFVAQGVTTICIGQDGQSPSDDTLRNWYSQVDGRSLRINVAPFVGHATVRALAGVEEAHRPTPRQLATMVRLVAQDLEAGAFGLTTGLEYRAGRAATLDELIAIARPVAQHDALVMSHLRSEDDDRIEGAIDELLAQGRGAGARVQISHLKVVHGRGVDRAERILARLEAARRAGVRITADQYPYEASYTGIGILFPTWADSPSALAIARIRRRSELANHLRERVRQRGGPGATLFGSPPWAGKTLAQVATEAGKPFEDVLLDDIGPDRAEAAFFVMDESLQTRLLLDPFVMIGSDGSPTARHPRGHGTFARIIEHHVHKRGLLSLEQAIHKMTGLPAATLGLDRRGRGLIRPGFAADLVLFDPARVRAIATYTEPHRLAEGVSWVLVNGQAVRADGAPTPARPGRALRH